MSGWTRIITSWAGSVGRPATSPPIPARVWIAAVAWTLTACWRATARGWFSIWNIRTAWFREMRWPPPRSRPSPSAPLWGAIHEVPARLHPDGSDGVHHGHRGRDRGRQRLFAALSGLVRRTVGQDRHEPPCPRNL